MIAVVMTRGPAWNPQLPLAGQSGFAEHVELITSLLEQRVAIEAGPFSDPSALVQDDVLALALLDLDSVEAAQALVANDPIVTGEIVSLHIHAWGGAALARVPQES